MHGPVEALVLLMAFMVPLGALFMAVRRYGRRHGEVRPAHWMIPGILVSGASFLFFTAMMQGLAAPLSFLLLLAAAVALVVLWFREFLTLMAMSDDAFPGRFDKALWFALMVLLPPVGLVAFASFRRSYWAVEKPASGVASEEWTA